jgi:hypothetical protein
MRGSGVSIGHQTDGQNAAYDSPAINITRLTITIEQRPEKSTAQAPILEVLPLTGKTTTGTEREPKRAVHKP